MQRMLKSSKLFFLLFIVEIILLISQAGAADLSILFILDGSGSMWGRIDDTAKIVLAKETMTTLIREIPENAPVGLISYGHRKKGDCEDIELMVPIGRGTQTAMLKQVQSINPRGKTPIHRSIKKAVTQLEKIENEAMIVLVSDGQETCDGDPCQLVESLRKKGIRFKMHVIGFDVTEAETVQLACIAQAGGGKYYSADDAAQLQEAFGEVKEEIIQTIKTEFGTLKVLGTGRDLYDVYDADGQVKLDYARTNQAIRLAPGTYQVSLQQVWLPVEVKAGEETVIGSGRIRVTGLGKALYAIYDHTGKRKIDFTRTNNEIELMAGTYFLELNGLRRSVTIETGAETEINAGSITVSEDSNALFAVYDAEGIKKLEFTRVNKPIEVLPGSYQVNIDDRWFRDVTVSPGETVELK